MPVCIEDYLKKPLTECGIPHAGRPLILSALADYPKVLWVLNDSHPGAVYPPSWERWGLEKVWFFKTENVMRDAKPIFLAPYFEAIVLDGFRNLRDDDMAFMALQARKLNIQILLIRDYFLTTKKGNVWALSRFNIFFRAERNKYSIQTVRGSISSHFEVRAYA